MLTVLLPGLSETGDFEVSLSYRYSPEYEAGLYERLGARDESMPIRLPEVDALESNLKKRLPGARTRPLRAAAWVLLHVLPMRQAFQVYDVVGLRRLFKRIGPDIVQINNGGFPGAGSANAAAIAARAAGVQGVTYVVNNLAYGYKSPLRWADYPIDRLAVRATDRFVTGSMAAAERLGEVLRLRSGQVETIPNAIVERSPDEAAGVTRRRLEIGDDDFVVSCIGRLERRKGQKILVEAVRSINPPQDGSQIVIVLEGEGPDRDALERCVSSVYGGARVVLAGHESNIWNLMRASDAIVLPSVANEDFPNVVLEAMSLSKPVIASRIAGTPEQIKDGVTGLLVPPGDPTALANAVSRLASDPQSARNMGHAGRIRFEKEFSPSVAVDRYAEMLRMIMASP